MKKTLTQLTLFVFAAVISFTASAQNGKQQKKGSNQKNNFVSSRAPGNHAQRAYNNGSSLLFPAAISGYYAEDFEGATFPPAGWQAVDAMDPNAQWAQSTALPYSGLNSAYCLYSAQAVNGEDWLILPQFTVVAGDSISFFLACEFVGYPPDATNILVSTTDSNLTSFTNVVANLSEGTNYPTVAGTYQYYSYDLSSFAGQDIYVAFQNTNTYGDGIFIDKVSIGTKPAINALSESIDVSSNIPVGTMSPMATFKNDGIAAATFDVTMTTLTGYSSTKTITGLGAGGSQQVTFDPWTTSAPGTETITVVTQLTGDLNPNDDTLSMSVSVTSGFVNYGWVSKGPMAIERFDAPTGAINSNDTSYLFAMGGIDAAFAIANSAEEFFPYSNSWLATTSSLGNGTFTSSGAAHGNKIYVAGGYNPNFVPIADNQIYDIGTSTWTTGAPMPTPVGDYALGVYNDSLFYYIGGYDGAGDQDMVQIYDPAWDSWTTGTPISGAAAGWRGGISGNKIVVTGGYNQVAGSTLATTYIGDIDPSNPANITWTTGADYPAGTISRHGAGASLDEASGLVIFTAGDPAGTGTGATVATYAYDVNANTWKTGPDKITGVNNICNLTPIVDNDTLWMASTGGYDGTNVQNVHEWLNMGPYVIILGIDNSTPTATNFSSGPNPFVKTTDIRFSLSHSSDVKIVIADVLGNEVEVLCDKNFKSGNQTVTWNGANYAKGIYFCQLTVNGKTATQKLLKY
jgi:hypothetical protein